MGSLFQRHAHRPDAPRIHPRLIEALLRHDYRHHMRELHRLLWRAHSLVFVAACGGSTAAERSAAVERLLAMLKDR